MAKATLINKEELKDFFKTWGTISAKCYDTNPKFAKKIGEHCLHSEHFSGSRGIYFFFDISEFSRNCSMQLNRHEVGTMKNQRSQRYCEEDGFGYFIPPNIANDEIARKDYFEVMEFTREKYSKIRNRLGTLGFTKEECNEDTRYVLTGATHTEGVWGFTLESLIGICQKRLCFRSQYEIRELVNLIKNEVLEVLPELKQYLVPKCVAVGYCKESHQCQQKLRPTKEEIEELIRIGKEQQKNKINN